MVYFCVRINVILCKTKTNKGFIEMEKNLCATMCVWVLEIECFMCRGSEKILDPQIVRKLCPIYTRN